MDDPAINMAKPDKFTKNDLLFGSSLVYYLQNRALCAGSILNERG